LSVGYAPIVSPTPDPCGANTGGDDAGDDAGDAEGGPDIGGTGAGDDRAGVVMGGAGVGSASRVETVVVDAPLGGDSANIDMAMLQPLCLRGPLLGLGGAQPRS
jgi:hypothetical protein